MNGLNERQSDAVFDVMARYEGFVRTFARGDCDHTKDCVHCRAQAVLDACVEVLSKSNAA
ncbi:MAG: hypothetical protein ACTSX8_10435 [Alphaproteobacteria bacterium]